MKIHSLSACSTTLPPASAEPAPIAPAAANVAHPVDNPYHLHVKLIAQKSMHIAVSANTRVIDLRIKIKEYAGAPITHWSLFYLEQNLAPSRELRDEYLISDCHIPHTATVWIHPIHCVN